MEIKIKWENEPEVQQRIRMNMDKLGNMVRDAMREAACETRDFMQARGAEDIAEAGNFGDRWQDAFKVDVSETQRTFRVEAYMDAKEPPVTYWPVFEYGADIEAKNPSGLMWLPWGLDKSKTGGLWPRAYPGDLFRVGNVLFDSESEQPMYFGTPSVHIPKKFHLHEIMREEAEKARDAFRRILSEMKQE